MKPSSQFPFQTSNKSRIFVGQVHPACLAIHMGHARCLFHMSSVPSVVFSLAKEKDIRLVPTDSETLYKMDNKSRHFLLECTVPTGLPLQQVDLRRTKRIVLLDHIVDPHNIGAIFRTAAEFSIDLLLIPKKRSGGITQTVCTVSTGAVFVQPFSYVQGSIQLLKWLGKEGFTIVGTAMSGHNMRSYAFDERTVLVLGNEGKGISDSVLKYCHHTVSIPTTNKVDSLNVSVAAGIFMYGMSASRD